MQEISAVRSKAEAVRKLIKPEQLSLWAEFTKNLPESKRSIPWFALRSALFAATEGAHPFVKNLEICSLSDIKIKFTGERLDQGDLNTWAAILHLLKGSEPGEQRSFSATDLLRVQNIEKSGQNAEILDARISRLKLCMLTVVTQKSKYEGNLIHEVFRETNKNGIGEKYIFNINQKLGEFFEHNEFTQIDWEIRSELKKKPLALWLHGFYSSHVNPFPMKVDTIRNLAGSSAKLDDFSKTIRKALDNLCVASDKYGQKFNWNIEGRGLQAVVHIERTLTESQARYAAKHLVSL